MNRNERFASIPPGVPRLRLPPCGDGPERGTWVVVLTPGGLLTVFFCPRCGVVNGLTQHHVRTDGRVSEAWQCHVPDCGAIARIELVDYDRASAIEVLHGFEGA
jgi:hypothetical protein